MPASSFRMYFVPDKRQLSMRVHQRDSYCLDLGWSIVSVNGLMSSMMRLGKFRPY